MEPSPRRPSVSGGGRRTLAPPLGGPPPPPRDSSSSSSSAVPATTNRETTSRTTSAASASASKGHAAAAAAASPTGGGGGGGRGSKSHATTKHQTNEPQVGEKMKRKVAKFDDCGGFPFKSSSHCRDKAAFTLPIHSTKLVRIKLRTQ